MKTTLFSDNKQFVLSCNSLLYLTKGEVIGPEEVCAPKEPPPPRSFAAEQSQQLVTEKLGPTTGSRLKQDISCSVICYQINEAEDWHLIPVTATSFRVDSLMPF